MSQILGLAADGLLIVGALGACAYCIVLSRRLRKFNDLEAGVGGAIAVLSGQVDDMTKALENARKIAATSAVSLDGLTERAEAASRRLELLMASLHDLPDDATAHAARAAPRAPVAAAVDEPEAAAEPVDDSEAVAGETPALFLSQRHRVTQGAA